MYCLFSRIVQIDESITDTTPNRKTALQILQLLLETFLTVALLGLPQVNTSRL
jgi:hypothetical protein